MPMTFDIPTLDIFHHYQCDDPIILFLLRKSMNARKRVSFDIPNHDNIHQYLHF